MPTLTTTSRGIVATAASAAVAAALVSGSETTPKTAAIVVVAAALGASMLWAGMARRRFFLALLFLTAPFDISKAVYPPLDHFFSPGLYVTVGEAVVVLLGLAWAAERLFVERRGLPLTTLDALAFGFLAQVWFGTLHAKGGMLAYASATSYSLCVLGFYVASHAIRDKRDIRLMLSMVLVSFGFETLYVAAQMATHSFLVLPGAKVAPVGTQGLNFEAEQISAFRPIGSFDHPNALADYLTLLLPPALAFVLLSRRRLPSRLINIAAAVLTATVALLLLTLSRGGWAAGTVGIVFVGAIYWRKRLIGSGHLLALSATLLFLVVTAVAAFPQIVLRVTEPDSRSFESRIVLTDQALTIIRANPLLGVGYGGYNRAALENIPPSFALISVDYQKQLLQLIVHDHYLLLAAELGVPAMLYWIFLMLRFVAQAWPLSRWRDPALFALGVGLAGSLASQMLFLSSDNYYTDIRVFLLWLTAGVLQAVRRIAGAEEVPRTRQPAPP